VAAISAPERTASPVRHSDERRPAGLADRLLRRPQPGYRRHSLYARVLVVNACVLVLASTALIFTPATVSWPIGVQEGVVLGIGVTVMIVANAALLRVSFGPLSRLVALMGTIDLLQPGQRLGVSGGVEVRQVIATFNEMLDRLEAERQASNRRTHSAQEAERRRVGQELHDEIGQRLTGMLLLLQQVAAKAPPAIRPALSEAQELARSTLDEVGRMAWQLRPGILDDLGLVRAVDALATSFEAISGTRIVRVLPRELPDLGGDAELALYRIAQESLTNVMRHAFAHTVELALFVQPGHVVLTVVDDGRGLGGGEAAGSGIRGMRERALVIGADLVVRSRERGGVEVIVDVPLEVDA